MVLISRLRVELDELKDSFRYLIEQCHEAGSIDRESHFKKQLGQEQNHPKNLVAGACRLCNSRAVRIACIIISNKC